MQDYRRVTFTNQDNYKADHLEKELRKVRAEIEALRQVVTKQEREEKANKMQLYAVIQNFSHRLSETIMYPSSLVKSILLEALAEELVKEETRDTSNTTQQ